jgi:hypothetical protein
MSLSHAGSDYLAQDMPLLGRLDDIPMMIAVKNHPNKCHNLLRQFLDSLEHPNNFL